MNQKIFLWILIASIGFYSCDTFLSQEDENVFYEGLLEENPSYAQGVLFHAYAQMIRNYRFEDVATDDAVSNDMSNGNNVYANFRRTATGEWSPFFDPTNVWDSSYFAINNVNYFLTFCNEVQWSVQFPERQEEYIKRYNAEARALRGYHYLRLLSRYGGIASDGSLLGVPVTGGLLTSNDVTNLPRPAFKVTMDQIYSDLDFAIKDLPYDFPNVAGEMSHYEFVNRLEVNRGRINGKIAMALKARAALLDASPAYNGGVYDTEKAKYAVKVSADLLKIHSNGGIPTLAPDRIFWNADDDVNNPEIIWRENAVNNRTLESANFPPLLNGSGRINPTQNLVDAFPMKNGYPISMLAESGYDPANPYADRDDRLRQNIFVNGSVLRTITINSSTDATLPNGNQNTNGLNVLPNYSTRTGYYLRKLLREDVNLIAGQTQDRAHFYTHMRWTEIFLLYAEAVNEGYGPDQDPEGCGLTARDVIAGIRNRAGITQPDAYLASVTTKEGMRELIRNERRLELCFEGHRFWDLRRWNLSLDEQAKGVAITGNVYDLMNVETRDFKPYMIYCPIPNDEVIKYPELLQNKDW